jgi:ethanolamine ammonia-lyase small subunit
MHRIGNFHAPAAALRASDYGIPSDALDPAERVNSGDAVGARVRARILGERDALAATENLQRYTINSPRRNSLRRTLSLCGSRSDSDIRNSGGEL